MSMQRQFQNLSLILTTLRVPPFHACDEKKLSMSELGYTALRTKIPKEERNKKEEDVSFSVMETSLEDISSMILLNFWLF